MKISSVNEPIARRTLTMGERKVIVIIGRPQPDRGDFYCPYSIQYLEQNRVSYAYGLDAVQALQLAMKKIGIDLEYIAKTENSPISWLSDTLGETGFPI